MSEPVNRESPEWAEARRRVVMRRAFASHLVTYLVVNAALVGVWAMTGAGYFWPGWAMLGWGIGLALHAWATFGRGPITDADVEAEVRRSRRTSD